MECPRDYYVHMGIRKCFRVCPMGTYGDESAASRLCHSCPAQCLACSSPLVCLACAPGFFLLEPTQQCIPQCPVRYFPNTFLRRC